MFEDWFEKGYAFMKFLAILSGGYLVLDFVFWVLSIITPSKTAVFGQSVDNNMSKSFIGQISNFVHSTGLCVFCVFCILMFLWLRKKFKQ